MEHHIVVTVYIFNRAFGLSTLDGEVLVGIYQTVYTGAIPAGLKVDLVGRNIHLEERRQRAVGILGSSYLNPCLRLGLGKFLVGESDGKILHITAGNNCIVSILDGIHILYKEIVIRLIRGHGSHTFRVGDNTVSVSAEYVGVRGSDLVEGCGRIIFDNTGSLCGDIETLARGCALRGKFDTRVKALKPNAASAYMENEVVVGRLIICDTGIFGHRPFLVEIYKLIPIGIGFALLELGGHDFFVRAEKVGEQCLAVLGIAERFPFLGVCLGGFLSLLGGCRLHCKLGLCTELSLPDFLGCKPRRGGVGGQGGHGNGAQE